MSPKSFVQFHQEGTEILWVQVRCLQTNIQDTNRPGPRGDSTRGGSPKSQFVENVIQKWMSTCLLCLLSLQCHTDCVGPLNHWLKMWYFIKIIFNDIVCLLFNHFPYFPSTHRLWDIIDVHQSFLVLFYIFCIELDKEMYLQYSLWAEHILSVILHDWEMSSTSLIYQCYVFLPIHVTY